MKAEDHKQQRGRIYVDFTIKAGLSPIKQKELQSPRLAKVDYFNWPIDPIEVSLSERLKMPGNLETVKIGE